MVGIHPSSMLYIFYVKKKKRTQKIKDMCVLGEKMNKITN